MCFYGIIYLKIEWSNFFEKKMLSKIFKKSQIFGETDCGCYTIVEDRIDTWSK